jgi:CHAD domain-containing protein
MDAGAEGLVDVAVSAIEARLRAALRLTWAVARKPGVSTVHRLRISCRRLRAAIALFHDVTPLPALSEVDEAARRMAKAVADLRAMDVAVGRLGRLSSRSTDAGVAELCRCVARALARGRREQASEQRRRLRKRAKALEKAIVARIPLLREGAVESRHAGIDGSVNDAVGPKIAALRAATRARIEKALGDEHAAGETTELDARLHRVRIAVKHWRYAEEVVAHIVPEACRGGARLKKLQELGGETQDLADLAKLVRREFEHTEKKGGAKASLLAAIGRQRETATCRFVEALKREIAEAAADR